MKINLSQLTRRYLFALGIIAVLALLAYGAARSLVLSRQVTSAFINVSGRQGMLAQRIGRFALQYATNDNAEMRDEARDELLLLIDIYEESHLSLTEGGVAPRYQSFEAFYIPPIMPESVRRHFFDEPAKLDEQARSFIDAVERLLNDNPANLELDNVHLEEIVGESGEQLLLSQNELVELYQIEVETAVIRFGQFQLALLLLMLLALALVALFIFRPTVEQIRDQTNTLTNANEQLNAQNEELLLQTRDLTLASEVGQSVSELKDLDILLANAVEMVRARFQLYYVQLYLVDHEAQQLRIKAGTGEIGRQLVENNFTLPLALNSINGIAALEKRHLIVNDTKSSVIFRPNKRLPRTRSEMVLPLMYQDEVIGILDLQNDKVDTFSSERLPVFQTVAGQLSVAIQNWRLINSLTEQAQPRYASQTETSWQAFLNGVERPQEWVISSEDGEENGRIPHTAPSHAAKRAFPLELSGAKIGEVELLLNGSSTLREDQLELVDKIAGLASSRLENLRLLAEADKYRAEAEFASSRLTGEAWRSYAEKQAHQGFAFDLNQVTNEESSDFSAVDTKMAKPFQVQGATIGQIALLDKEELSEEEDALLTAVTQQISSHIENLRLTEQTEKALQETEQYNERLAMLNQLSAEVATLENDSMIAQIVAKRTKEIINVERVSLTMLSETEPDQLIILVGLGGSGTSTTGAKIPFAGSPMESAIKEGEIGKGVYEADDQRYEARFFPILVEGRAVGTLNVASENIQLFTQRNEQLVRQIASLTSSAFERAVLSGRTQNALYESNTLFELVAKLNEASTNRQILDTLVESAIGEQYRTALYFSIESDKHDAPRWLTLKERSYADERPEAEGMLPLNIPLEGYQTQLEGLWRDVSFGTVLFVEEIATDERLLPEVREQMVQGGNHSLLLIPLNSREKWLGMIHIYWPEPKQFSRQEKRLLATVSEQASVVANQIRLLQETQDRATSLSTIAEVEAQLSKATEDEDIITAILPLTDDAFAIELSYFDEVEGEVTYNLTDAVRWKEGKFLPIDKHAIELTPTHPIYNEWQMDSSQIILVEDVETDLRMDGEAQAIYSSMGVRALMLLPLYSLGRWQGSITLSWAYPMQFSDGSVFVWNQILDPLAANVASKRLLNETEMLYQIGGELNQANRYTDVLQVLRKHTISGQNADLIELFYFDRPWVEDNEPNYLDVVGSLKDGEIAQPLSERLPVSILPQLLIEKRDEIHAIENVNTNPYLEEPSRNAMLNVIGIQAALFVPILVAGNWIGGVAFYYDKPTQFSRNDLRRLRPIGEQVSIVVQGIRFLRQAELRALREKQLREISTKIRSSTNIETIMRTTVEELGEVLGRHAVVYMTPGTEGAEDSSEILPSLDKLNSLD